MSFIYVRFAILLSVLIGTMASPQSPMAQTVAQHCLDLVPQITHAVNQREFRTLISLERQKLTYCKNYMQLDEYVADLAGLAIGLNGDGQHQEALGIAERCLQVRDGHFECVYGKADALSHLGRLREAKDLIERSTTLGAITEVDVSAKRALQALLAQINSTLQNPRSTRESSSAVGRPGNIRVGQLSGLPGGMKCADVLNNGQEWCAFTIAIGEIEPGVISGIQQLLEYRRASQRRVIGSAVLLDSPGGDVQTAMEIGRIVRREGLRVIVDKHDRCVSACIFVLAAAEKRALHGRIGIHRPWFAKVVRESSADKIAKGYRSQLEVARTYLREMNVSPTLLDEMLRIEPDNVRYLSRSELNSYGLGEGPPSSEIEDLATARETMALKAAQAYGISREEYMRRDALIEQTCPLGHYLRAGEQPKPSDYGRPVSLEDAIQEEEAGWSRCYKAIMISGR